MSSPLYTGESRFKRVELVLLRVQSISPRLRASGLLTLVVALFTIFFTLGVEAAPKGRRANPGEVRASVLKRMEAILATSDSFRDLSKPNLPLKGGGMVDGGGGGDYVEAEVSYFLTPIAARILSIKNVVRDFEILNDEQLRKLEELLPRKQNVQRICVLAVVNPKIDPCGDRAYRIVVDPKEWKAKSDAEKRDEVARKLLGLIGITGSEAQSEKLQQLEEILSPKKEVFHRLDVVSGSSNGTATVSLNGRTERQAQLSIDRSGAHPKFKLEGASEDRNGTYVVNSQSPYLNVDYCEDKASQMSVIKEYGRSIFYREIKPLIEACEKRIASGKEVKTLWISTKTKLVINCR
jgi:hypothetical protein